jgi:hypothetical protein
LSMTFACTMTAMIRIWVPHTGRVSGSTW